MSRYWILKAVAYMDNGQPLLYNTIPKEPVEIDDDVAATLGEKVRRVDPPKEVVETPVEEFKEPPKETVEDSPEERPEANEGATDTLLDFLTVSKAQEREDLPPVTPKPKRRRKTEETSDGDKDPAKDV